MGRRDERGPPKGGLIRKGIRGLAGGVGLASESLKAHRNGKAKEGESVGMNSDAEASPDQQGDPFESERPPPSYSEGQYSKAGSDKYPTNESGEFQQPGQNLEIEEPSLEDEWNLDDAQDEIHHGSSENSQGLDPIFDDSQKKGPVSESGLEDGFLRNHPLPHNILPAPTSRLPLTVVLPQRRPKDRSRGFIRAYAPVLENCGIDQATWLSFLDTFQKSSAANPWLNAINMAQFATLALPTPIGLAVGYAIRQITKIAIEVQSRERTNKFLYKINEEFFRPRGLYCLVMTWNPESTQRIQEVNLASTIALRSDGAHGLTTLRKSDGKTYGDWEFPETAPLVFPALDQLAAQTSEKDAKLKTEIAKKMNFAAEYWDKRATAEYAMKNPNSVLANVPQGEFSSRYADPKSKAASGSVISFVSGGHLVPNPESRGLIGGIFNVVGQAVRGETQGSGWDRLNAANAQQQEAQLHYQKLQREQGMSNGSDQHYRYQNQFSRDYRGRGKRGRRGHGPIGAYKKFLRKDVLYLMVVNMPTEEEMAEADARFG